MSSLCQVASDSMDEQQFEQHSATLRKTLALKYQSSTECMKIASALCHLIKRGLVLKESMARLENLGDNASSRLSHDPALSLLKFVKQAQMDLHQSKDVVSTALAACSKPELQGFLALPVTAFDSLLDSDIVQDCVGQRGSDLKEQMESLARQAKELGHALEAGADHDWKASLDESTSEEVVLATAKEALKKVPGALSKKLEALHEAGWLSRVCPYYIMTLSIMIMLYRVAGNHNVIPYIPGSALIVVAGV